MKEKIVRLLSSEGYEPMSRNRIAGSLSLKKGERIALRRELKELVSEGKVVRIDRRRYAMAAPMRLVRGVLKGHPRGFGFVIPEDKTVDDIYVHRENMSTGLDGDRVLVRTFPSRKRVPGKKKAMEGEIVQVVERANTDIAGVLRKSGHFTYVMPENRGIFQDIYIGEENLKGAQVGDRVVARILQWESKHLNPEGRIVQILGKSEDWRTDLKSVIVRFGYRRSFPKGVAGEAAAVAETIPPAELKKRRDLRGTTTFTIDPKNAKDFDDAVSLERREEGGWLLGVHIADVSRYIQEGCGLDVEARNRGNSVYLLDDVIPMLPKKLSGDLCSLRQGRDRLTKTVLLSFGKKGALQRYEIFDSVIRCTRRFNYKEVNEILAGERRSPQKELLEEMAKLSRLLLERRANRGATIFDMADARVLFGPEGEIEGIERVRQGLSESMIEEFMLAANEAVAKHLRKHRVPTIYRVHDEPDSEGVGEFCRTARSFGYKVPDFPSRAEVNRVLSKAQGKPESYLINLSYLRSLKMAEYSARNRGHYGLASSCYLHFTSPIRRYPDLVVHRCLDRLREGGGRKGTAELEEVAANCSEREREADAAEREVIQSATLRYLEQLQREGRRKVFQGIIIDISRFEVTVFLEDFLIEGSIRLKSLAGDYYKYDREKRKVTGVRTRRTLHYGQVVKVRLASIDVIRRELELELVP